MKNIRRAGASLAIMATLVAGTSALATGTASAKTSTPASVFKETGASWFYCGYDSRYSPPTVRRGSAGNTVREAQCMLRFWGFSVGPSGIDGDFGPDTERATERFQRACGIADDGIIGPITWSRLRNGC